MKTNKEKFDACYAQLDGIESAMLAGIFPSGRPTSYWAVRDYQPVEVPISRWLYYWGPAGFRFDKPTRQQIENVKTLVASPPPFDPKNLRIISEGKFSNNISMDYVDGKTYSRTREPMVVAAVERERLYKPREGYRPCTYCGKQRRPEELIQATIISPNWKHTGYKSPPRDYCKADGCAGYDQMAHEG